MRTLEEQGYEVYLPLLTRWEKKTKSSWRKRQQAMFPRYGFVRCGRAGQGLGPIRSTPGVSGLVVFGTTPATLDEATLAAIRDLAESQSWLNDKSPFCRGDAVGISCGPLQGLNGIISTLTDERVTVMLSLLGRETPVVLLADQLTPA
jgi:transcriptional antiterminator RfaH